MIFHAYSFSPDSLRRELPPLIDGASPAGDAVSAYLAAYGLDTLGIRPIIGTFRSDSFICVGQIYRPEKPAGTVFMLHGYFDHTGTVVNGIAACLAEGYTVAACDLPGHGLSSGERGAINDFSEYAAAFGRFTRCCGGFVDTPYVFIGHSTGCAVGYEFLCTSAQQPFAKIIFLAPLVRMVLYHVSRFGNSVMRPFLTTAPRWFRNASHDREFLRRFRKDPLQPTVFPIRWAGAYYRWFDRIQEYTKQSFPLVVIQGTGDKVVDWRYNLPWIEKQVPGSAIIKIKGARHQLLNEAQPYRSQCIDSLRALLRKGG